MATEAVAPPAGGLGVRIRQLAGRPRLPFFLLLISVVTLVGLGMLMILSASAPLAQSQGVSPYFYVLKQLVSLVAAVIPAVLLAFIPPDKLQKLGGVAWGTAFCLLLLVLTPLGVGSRGNQNWLALGPIQIQPSEFAKLALIVWAAKLFHSRQDRPHAALIPFIIVGGCIPLLVMAGHDLGTVLIIGVIMIVILWAAGISVRVLGPFSAVAALGAFLAVNFSGNRMGRIAVWLDPTSDPDLARQPMAALYAMAAGGWWGAGLGAGKQKWGGLMDGAHTDYIFAVLGEELGLFGALIVILLFALIAWSGFVIALRSDKLFNRITATAITAWLSMQAVINVFVVMHVLPVLGVPLPFVSYGGTALMSSLMGVGVLLSIARDLPDVRAYRSARPSKKLDRPRMTSVMAATKED